MTRLLQYLILLTAIAIAPYSAPAFAAPKQKNCAFQKNAAQDALRHNGTRISVHVEGQGPDVILIPGLSTPADVWYPTVASLRECYTLHVIQVKGFGDQPIDNQEADKAGEPVAVDIRTREVAAKEADINAKGPMLDAVVEEIAAYIKKEARDSGRPVIVGHSIGGLSALMIGARYPDVAGGIFVVDALPFIGTLFDPAATVDTVKPQAQAMADGMRSQYGKTPAAPLAADSDPGERSQAGFYAKSVAGRIAVARWTKTSDVRVVAQAFYDDMTTDMRSELPKIKAPVGLLYAQDDSVMTPEAATKVFVPQYAGTPIFDARMVSGSRHFIMLDQPEKFAAELESFLTSIALRQHKKH